MRPSLRRLAEESEAEDAKAHRSATASAGSPRSSPSWRVAGW